MVNLPGNQELFLGIDGGGTKCRACITDQDGMILGSGIAGPANPLHGIEETFESIKEAAELALEDARLPISAMADLVAGAGLAGVNLPSLYTVIDNWKHPFSALYLTTDLHSACLGAHKGGDGAVIIAGTGSCGYATVDDKEYLLGGYGFPFGDQGGGAWMGLEAIKAALLAFDQVGPKTQLTESIADFLQVRGLMIVEQMSKAKSSEYASLAPLVFQAAENGDPEGLRIVREGAAYISTMTHKLLAHEPPRFSILGGLSVRMLPWLDPDIKQRLSLPWDGPEVGAIFYAQQKMQLIRGD
jgi:glucosamine kinase